MGKISKVFSIVLFLGIAACQKVPEATSGLDDLVPNDGDAVKLCDDGTLNCHVDLPPGNTAVTSVAFENCVKQCLEDAGCATWDTSPNSCAQYNSCSDSCDYFDDDGVMSSDDLNLPSEPRKAVKVTIEGCIEGNVATEIHAQGAEFYFDTNLDTGAPTANYKKRFRIGVNPICKKDFRRKIKVNFEPITSTAVEIKGTSYAVTPFANGSAVSMDCKMVHSTPCGLPAAMRDEMDFSQVAWMLKDIDKSDLIQQFVDFLYVNNNIAGGQSIVVLYPFGKVPVKEKVTFVVFSSAK